MARNRKPTHDLLLPGADGWSRWTGTEGAACEHAASFGESAGVFAKEAHRRVLALPASQAWVLPAWLHGQPEHLRDMAMLHLERMGVRVSDPDHGLQVRRIQEKDGAHLTCILALKDQSAPLWDTSRLPDEVMLSAHCRQLPADSIIIQREMTRLVVTITNGTEIIYCSPLSAHRLDELALSELNHLCVQLGFQCVLGSVQGIVLWLDDEGDLDQIERVTGLPARRESAPAPTLPEKGSSTLLPADIMTARKRQQARARARVMALSIGLAVAACVAVMMVFISSATRERDMLLDKIADLTPQSSQVLDQKKAWIEASPAVDPGMGPMQVLLDCMSPASSIEVGMTNFEWSPSTLVLRGRTALPSLALQYTKEISEVEALSRYTFDTPAPQIASDNSATFELKGETQP
ncbi:MAG: hypothetical protein V4662_07770 [Verrucomicrobiota bacterium]